MPLPTDALFVHHYRSEGMIDSVGSSCFATICREPTLALVQDCEDEHICPGPPRPRAFLPWEPDPPPDPAPDTLQ